MNNGNPKYENSRTATALVTGASGGIGFELAKLLAHDRCNLVLVARSEDRLMEIAAELRKEYRISVRVLVKDLSDSDAPRQIFDTLRSEDIRIDILVNNAGYTVFGEFARTPATTELEMMQVNMVALTHLTKLFLPEMLRQKKGRILNLGSTASFQPGPLMAIYYATKSYVLFFSEALAEELRGTGVTVTCLCPGPTQTGFQKRGGMEKSKLVAGKKIMDAHTVAEMGYRGMMKGKRIVIPGFRNKMLAQSIRISPRRVTTKIVRLLQENR
ncbi:MAG TPA: SDR family oxidoreductase [Bacteroidota bacterium]|nr:SDR family oxidoreductase [Bacteroidota bacterium]